MAAIYDDLASRYHLIYADWEASIARQGEAIDRVSRARWGSDVRRVLDVSCGVGTQALGLAARGLDVTGSDLSTTAIERARREASMRGLDIRFSVGDMRDANTLHGGGFDLVISVDNSVPHLLTDEDIGRALGGMHACLRPGGGVLISVRDYEVEERGRGLVKPFGVREVEGRRVVIFQVWDFDGDHYDFGMYFVEEEAGCEAATHVMRSRYYAISTERLMELMREAGFEDVERLDDVLHQPVLVGTRAS